MRETPTIEHATGMLNAIKASHTCTEACTGTTGLGDGKVLTRRCPWEQIDLDSEVDRRIVGSVYAIEARAAMGALS